MKYEIDIFYYLDIYKRHWKRMVFLRALVVCVTAMIQSMKPVTYRSTLIALSSKKATPAGNFEKFFGLSMGTSSDEIIFSILKSRRMRTDINRNFKTKDKPRFWWSLSTYIVTGGFAIEVTGSDPDLTRDIANFAADNVDEINNDIVISTEKGLVKVLDPALKGLPMGRNVSKKVTASGLFVFLIYALVIFFKEYFFQLKSGRR